ncbi:MAG TPA: M28 family peptidase [Terriglobales bacterium]|jgi:putative aminopeptidase FrvX|nr:M28 family peptidase [Terriglobales bacterium]
MRFRSGVLISIVLLVVPAALFAAGLSFQAVKREVVEQRLASFSRDNTQREAILKKMFTDLGCADHLTEEQVEHLKQPDLICVLPGRTNQTIVVGAHFDHVLVGDGVVDNWSGASLLPSLYQGLRTEPRQHTFIFVAFTGEEKGELGSQAYVRHMSKDEVARTEAMVNMDTLGLGPTEMWLSHADPYLAAALRAVAKSLSLPLGVVNVDKVGSSDSEEFARRKIPRITIHSVTQQTWPILHSSQDNMKAVHLDDFYDSYRLIEGYLVYLDGALNKAGGMSQ